MRPQPHPDTPFAKFLQHLITEYPEQRDVADTLRLSEPALSSYKVGRRGPSPGLLRRFREHMPAKYEDALRAYIRQKGGVSLPVGTENYEKERLAYALKRSWDGMTREQAQRIADHILLGEPLS